MKMGKKRRQKPVPGEGMRSSWELCICYVDTRAFHAHEYLASTV